MRYPTLPRWLLSACCVAGVLGLLIASGDAQPPGSAYKVTFKDGAAVTSEIPLPIDPTPRAVAQHSGGFAFGITVDGNRICFSQQGSIWCHLRVDGQEHALGFGDPGKPGLQQPPRNLTPGPNGKKRVGFETVWANKDVRVTQVVELVPSKPAKKTDTNQKRRLDTYRISYVVENIAKDGKARKIEFKSSMDILIVNNDGALCASPTTHPGKILNGVTLRGKEMPEYVHLVQNPDVNNPGFVATLSFKQRKADGPDVFVMTNLGVVHNGWEPPAQQAGDSACCILWNAKEVRPGDKRVMAYAYGGGLATDPDNEGKVNIALGGSFEPGKLCEITALVEDPSPNQSLTLELPPGMERVEGREVQPVPPPGLAGNSAVLWKARVQRPGDFAIKIHSSTGVTQVKHVSVEAVQAK